MGVVWWAWSGRYVQGLVLGGCVWSSEEEFWAWSWVVLDKWVEVFGRHKGWCDQVVALSNFISKCSCSGHIAERSMFVT